MEEGLKDRGPHRLMDGGTDLQTDRKMD